jgi:hypothetical protein
MRSGLGLAIGLPGYQLFKVGLGLVQELLPTIDGVVQVGDQVPSLKGHVELEVGHVFAKIFPQGGIGWRI